MTTEYMTEQEQIEQLKKWFKEYSLVIAAGVILAILSISGWRYWQQRVTSQEEHASRLYDVMISMGSQHNDDEARLAAQKILKKYSGTVYASLADLQLASYAIDNKKNADAISHLQHALDSNATSPSLKQIARIRLARVYIAENQGNAALSTLSTVDDSTFAPLTEEVKGDAYFSLKDNEKARLAYQKALFALPDAERVRPLLQIKYDNLAEPHTTK